LSIFVYFFEFVSNILIFISIQKDDVLKAEEKAARCSVNGSSDIDSSEQEERRKRNRRGSDNDGIIELSK